MVMVIDRNDPEPTESSLAEMVLRRNDTIIVPIDLSSALRLCKFETQFRMVSVCFESIFGHFNNPICLQK